MFGNERVQNRSYASAASRASYDAGLRQYMLNVYNFMSIALAISGFVALLVSRSETLMQLIFGSPLGFVVMLAPLGYVIFFSMKAHKMTADKAKTHLFIFAGLMGLSLSSIFIAYTGASITRVFFITAISFGGMSLYGYTTKKDLGPIGSFLIMGVIGIVVASLVNLFLKSSGLDFTISVLGVLIFAGLTAYDTQRIKQIYYSAHSADAATKFAVLGALSLYMDFINLFISLLRLFGERR